VQLVALFLGQASEEVVLRIAERLIGLSETARAGGRNGDHVPATISRVSLALDQAILFERVKQVHENAVVDPHELGQLALADRTPVVQQVKDAQVSRLEIVLGEHRADMTRELLTEHDEREPGPGIGVAKDLAGLVGA
jgi:hypothetical protein